jgi:hypothetical protein
MWQAIGVLGLLVAFVCLVALTRPIRVFGIRMPTGRRAAGIALIGLIVFVVGAVNEKTTPAPVATAANSGDALRARAQEIVGASRGMLVTFTVSPPGQQRDTVAVEWQAPSGFVAARVWADTRDLLRAIHESGLGSGGMIWMRVRLPARDVYGTATTVPGLSLLFRPDGAAARAVGNHSS